MSRIRVAATISLMMLFLAFGSSLPVSGQPAGTGQWSNVKACFVYTTGAVYESKDLFLYQWNGSSWVLERNYGKTDESGCGTYFNVDKNAYYYIQAYWSYNVGYVFVAWNGNSNVMLSGDAGTVFAGTSVVGWQYLNF